MVSSAQIYNFGARLAACIFFASLDPTWDMEILLRGIELQYAPYRERPVCKLQETLSSAPPGTYPSPGFWSLVSTVPVQDLEALVVFHPRPGQSHVDVLNFAPRNLHDDLHTWQASEVIEAAQETLPIPPRLLTEFTRRGLRPLRPLGASLFSVLSAMM